MRYALIITFFIAMFDCFAQEKITELENPRVEYWPGNIWRQITNGTDIVAYSIVEALYETINSFSIQLSNHHYVRTDLKLKRKVFDNQDVLNSYTVMDYLNFEAQSKNLNISAPLSLPNVSFGINLGVKGSLNWLNIRQVLASAYSTLPVISQNSNEENSNLESAMSFSPNEFWDPSFRPRISKLWNLVNFPIRIPFTPYQFNKMDNGELISWSINGYVELGPDIGFRLIPENIAQSNGSAKAFFRNFLKGSFRVTILKENNQFVRVKLSKENATGYRLGIGPTSKKLEIFEGFLIFEGTSFETNLLEQNISMIPFQFELKKELQNTFDVGYRFDLSDPSANEAFYKAVWGSFYKAYELQGRRSSNGNLVVEKLFRKKATSITQSSDQILDLAFFTRNLGKKTQSTKAKIYLEDGEHQVFKEVTSIDKSWKLAWGRFEKLKYSFDIALDKTAYLKGKENSFQMVVEANLEDSHTTGHEMQQYINLVEQALGNRDLLPDLPSFVPMYLRFNSDDDYIFPENISLKIAKYRRSSFYYGFNITQDQILQLAKVSKNQMWPILEKAFGILPGKWSTRSKRRLYRLKNLFPKIANIPLFLANIHLRKGSDVETAKKIYANWISLQNAFNSNNEIEIDRKLKILSQMFEVKHFGHELLRILLFGLSNSELDYFLVATNNSFGRIAQRGKVTTNPEYLLNLTDTAMDFERLAGGFRSNPKLVIKDLNVKVLSDESIKINFHLNHTPKLLYFKLFKSNRLQKYRVMAELVFRNKERFKEGENQIIISKKSIDDLEYELATPLSLKNFYNITLSSSMDRFSWGKVASKRFYYDTNINKESKLLLDLEPIEIQEEIFEWEKENL